MRWVLCLLAAFATTLVEAQSSTESQRELSNVAAFARLYGVVRYFYPSDAANALDWDRFAVLGVGRTRSAADAPSLATTLTDLFAPLGPGIEIGTSLPAAPTLGPVDRSLVSWTYLGPGFDGQGAPYSSARSNRFSAPPPSSSPGLFVRIQQSIPADSLRGKRIRLRARARVTTLDRPGWAGLWLRVDRTPPAVGFFDNMQNRPIRQTEWRDYVIEGPVADDATGLVFGALASESIPAEFDAFELAVADGDAWTTLPIRDPGFETGPDPRASGWGGNAVTGAQLTVFENAAPEGRRFVRLTATTAPPAVGRILPNATARTQAFVDVALGQGLHARVRTALSEADARASESGAMSAAVSAIVKPAGRSDLDVRLADVVVAWSVLRHFYPYWDVAGVNWDDRLAPQLGAAYVAEGRDGQRRALLHLVEEARDGHGNVVDPASPSIRGVLPIDLRLVEGRLVVAATSAASDAPLGSVINAIGGQTALDRLGSAMSLVSGSPQWKRWRATRELATCMPNTATSVSLELPSGAIRNVSLPCLAQPPEEIRPAKISELSPGIQYVDLTRAAMADLRPALTALAAADGVVFDLRGYPTDIGSGVLPFLLADAEHDRWMHIASLAGPFGENAEWRSVGWNVTPAMPQVTRARVFLTDGRAISYAESVLAYVSSHRLGTIIGAPTAGANGNVARATVPGGFAFTFTGMRVTGHDGASQQHLVGILPDIPLEPTIVGLRSGRDELLERAVSLLQRGK